jgi:hypothetical protein
MILAATAVAAITTTTETTIPMKAPSHNPGIVGSSLSPPGPPEVDHDSAGVIGNSVRVLGFNVSPLEKFSRFDSTKVPDIFPNPDTSKSSEALTLPEDVKSPDTNICFDPTKLPEISLGIEYNRPPEKVGGADLPCSWEMVPSSEFTGTGETASPSDSSGCREDT